MSEDTDRTTNDRKEEIPDRKMNDSTMPPPQSRGSGGGTAPVVLPVVSSVIVAASSTSTSAATATDASSDNTAAVLTQKAPPAPAPAPPRYSVNNKKAVPPPRPKRGFGLSDWNRLVASSKDLALRHGAPLRKNITWKEIRQHNSVHDGWVVLKGKVYFISPYLAYHPGGELILKPVLGKDASTLFNKYHQWVNEDGLIGKLLIGYLDTTSSSRDEHDSDDDSEDDEEGRGGAPSSAS